MSKPPSNPETYYLSPTPHVPNSVLPALIYRSVIPFSSAGGTKEVIEPNHWLYGGTWRAYPTHHFHSVTHECYAVFKGRSKLLLGRGPLDEAGGIEVDVGRGDIIVLPAGVSHCSISSEDDYEYTGLYPEGSPHWDNNWCKAGPEETEAKAENARSVPIPEYDPIYGEDGPLVQIWKSAAAEKE